MALIDGDEFVSGDILSFQQGNRIKDHWRAAAAVANPQPGMPFSDSDEEQLYHRWAASWRLVLQEWDNVFIINPSGGGHYKTIQAALTAENAGGETFLVPPGTYTDTIHFSAVNQSVIALGDFTNTEVTQADANIVDAGAFTGCVVQGIKINLSAPTTAIYAIQASTGSVDMEDCHLHLATAVALVAANQPALVNISGAGEIQIIRGVVEFFHTGNTGGGGIKCAFRVSANGALLHLHSINKVTITNSGTSLSTCIYTDFGTAIAEMHFCHDVTVTDPNCTILVGLGYIGAAGAHNIMSNHIDVVATNNAGWGLYHVGTGTIRMSHNSIHVTDAAGTSNSYYIGAAATLETHMDEWRADDGSTIIAGGTLHIVSSEDEGELTISSSLDMLDDARITGGNDDTILEMYDESVNDAVIWGLPVAAKRGLIFCDVADIAVDFTGLITANAQPVAWFIDLDNDSYLGVGHQANDRPGIWSGAADTSILALQYDANADITIFESSGAGENREERIYGYITAGTAARYMAFRVDDTNDEALWEAENNANLEGLTANLLEANQRFRIRGGIGAQIMDNLRWIYGTDDDASMEYDETTNDAWIFGVPVSPKRGVIWCDVADIAVDFTGIITASAQPQHHIVDADNDSVFDWGFYADDVGLLTVPANPLRENLLTNAHFGVWSQSDTNKGLAALVFNNGTVAPVVGEAINGVDGTGKVQYLTISGGTWGGGDAAGTVYLGAVSGAYQDTETIVGSVAASFDVNGDTAIGVANDPMNNDSTGDWTDDGAGIVLAFAAAEYTVTTTAANQRAWIANSSVEKGHIYIIELDIKNGTDAGIEIQGYFDDGAAQYGTPIKTTAAGWVSVSWTFECATTDAAGDMGFRVIDNMGGNNIEVRRFSCYEIVPCTTEATGIAFDTWEKNVATTDLYREHSGINTKDGSFYALKLVPVTNTANISFPKTIYDREEWYMQFRGRPVSFGGWINTNTASHVRLSVYDGAQHFSSYHTGGGAFEWMETAAIINVASTIVFSALYMSAAPNIDGTTIVYLSQPILAYGASIGTDGYEPKCNEFIWLEKNIPSRTYDGLLDQSDLAFTDLNIEADSDAMLPKGAKVIAVLTDIEDSGSGAGLDVHLELRKDATAGTFFINSVAGKPNDIHNHVPGLQSCDVSGDIDIHLDASGANTLDINQFEYHGVQVN